MDGGYKVLHQDLVDSGTLGAVRGEVREFKRDAVFSSPSAAAAVVWGRSANGRTSWVVKETGQSLAEWEQGIPAGQLEDEDRKSGVEGRSGSVRLDLGGSSIIKKKNRRRQIEQTKQ